MIRFSAIDVFIKFHYFKGSFIILKVIHGSCGARRTASRTWYSSGSGILEVNSEPSGEPGNDCFVVDWKFNSNKFKHDVCCMVINWDIPHASIIKLEISGLLPPRQLEYSRSCTRIHSNHYTVRNIWTFTITDPTNFVVLLIINQIRVLF